MRAGKKSGVRTQPWLCKWETNKETIAAVISKASLNKDGANMNYPILQQQAFHVVSRPRSAPLTPPLTGMLNLEKSVQKSVLE